MQRLYTSYECRREGDGRGIVASIEIDEFVGIILRDQDGNNLAQFDGRRWNSNGLISRTALEQFLQVDRGFVDGVEIMYGIVRHTKLELECLYTKKDDELKEHIHDYIEKSLQLEEEMEVKYQHGRHAVLARWRSKQGDSGRVPESLSHIEGIEQFDADQPCVIYFLVHDGEVVYVGQSADWPARLVTHVKQGEKRFDSVFTLGVDRLSLREVESKYIKEFQPKYNKTGK
jgi:hypothetical protein